MKRPSQFALILLGSAFVLLAFLAWVKTEPARFLAQKLRSHGVTLTAGDIVFQDLDCGLRCQLIRDATRSPYSHVGIVLREGTELVIWEAFHPVGPTPVAEWVDRGRDEKFALYRLTPELLKSLPQIEAEIRAMAGRPYDGDYQWDEDRIYCSELIAKAVNRASHRDVFAPHPLGAGALGSKAGLVLQMSHGRLSEQTPLVSPYDLIRSASLTKVFDELADSEVAQK